MPKQLIEGYQRFRRGYFHRNQDRLATLIKGQAPRIALLSCCYSRVDPTIIFDAEPGDLFVFRNVANLVPPFENEGLYHGTSAALEFAVTGLVVSDIVVLGHAQCGGIRALMDKPPDNDTVSFIDRWMTIAEPARIAAHRIRNDRNVDKYVACEQFAVEHALQNLMTYPWILSRVEQGILYLHGWYYDLFQGTLARFDPASADFVPLTIDASGND